MACSCGVVSAQPPSIQPGGYLPYWAAVPPHAPSYVNPPAYFRRTQPEVYTAPNAAKSYSKWWGKWHIQQPDWKEEHYRLDSRTPMMRFRDHTLGTNQPPHRPSAEQPHWRREFLRRGDTDCEVTRARGIREIHFTRKNPNLYQFSNAMTSTQYQKGVPGIYGPLYREKVYGLKTQKSLHGTMRSEDFYF